MKRAAVNFFLFIAGGAFVWPEAKITLVTPGLEPGYESLEAVIAAEVIEYRDDMAAILTESLDKPLFMEGFGGAAAMALQVPSAVHEADSFFLSVGSALSVYAENLSPRLADELRSLDPESDMKAGLCVQPVSVNIGIPLSFLLKGLYLGGSVGYIDADAGEYGIRALSAGGFLGYRILKKRMNFLTWEGLSFEAGGDWAQNRMAASIAPGEISKTIEFDPDDDGPLVAEEITFHVDPVIRTGIESALYSFRGSLGTELTVLNALSLSVGASAVWNTRRTGITVESDEPVIVDGYLADLINPDEPGRVIIEGTASEIEKTEWGYLLQGAVKLRFGPVTMTLPLLWEPNKALGTGMFIGIRL